MTNIELIKYLNSNGFEETTRSNYGIECSEESPVSFRRYNDNLSFRKRCLTIEVPNPKKMDERFECESEEDNIVEAYVVCKCESSILGKKEIVEYRGYVTSAIDNVIIINNSTPSVHGDFDVGINTVVNVYSNNTYTIVIPND